MGCPAGSGGRRQSRGMTSGIFRRDGPGRQVTAAGSWQGGTPAALLGISPVAVPDIGFDAGNISNAASTVLAGPVASVRGTVASASADLPR